MHSPVAYLSFAENKLSDQEALEEIRQLSVQLKRIQEMAPPKGVAVMTISSLLDGLKTPGGMIVVAAAATHASSGTSAAASSASTAPATRQSALPLLALNAEMQKYNQQLQQNNNATANGGRAAARTGSIPTMVLETPPSTATPTPTGAHYEERAMNTELSGDDFREQLLRRSADGHIICSRCLDASLQHFCCCPPPAQTQFQATQRSTCEQLGSPQQEGSLSFANIKLECMCSQSEDLDQEHAQQQRRRPAVRSAATNTPPPSCKRTARNLLETELSISYQICDNCRSKFKLSSDRSITPPVSALSAAPTVVRRRSGSCSQPPAAALRGSELLLSGAACGHVAKTARSNDDIALYTSQYVVAEPAKPHSEKPGEQAAPAAEAEAATAPSLGNISSTSNSSGTNQAARPKRPDKLVLDLNDRSKYTKEVSV